MDKDVLHERAEIDLGRTRVPYRLQRSPRRRTVALAVDPDRGLVVYCPRRFAQTRLDALLRRKAPWILEKIAQADRHRALRRPTRWQPGARLPLLGATYPLEVRRAGQARTLTLEGEQLCLTLPARLTAPLDETALREHVLAGYLALARETLPRRVDHLQRLVGVAPRIVRVKSQKKRWGSCSAKGALNFNWRLVLAPLAVMDYVIVHELCHLLHLDHSPRFWRRVAAVLPGYRAQQAWLREFGPGLYL